MKRDKLNLASASQYVAGMPQLCWYGLSENWLLKECGHLHWIEMSRQQGRLLPDFFDTCGRKVYAAFKFIRIQNARLHLIQEHTPFAIATMHADVGNTQNYSRHEVVSNGQCIGVIEMLSTYLRRDAGEDNKRIVRATTDHTAAACSSSRAAEFAQVFSAHTRNQRTTFADLERNSQKNSLFQSTFTPCPNGDFNGARLLYFASYQSIVDRAEWELLKDLPWLSNTGMHLTRDILFTGNINLGDSIHTCIEVLSKSSQDLSHFSILRRSSDGNAIAYSSTSKCMLQLL